MSQFTVADAVYWQSHERRPRVSCELIRDESGAVVAIACGSPWGIGVYYHCHDETCFCGGESVYGFPPKVMNPEDFTPDAESCTEKEIDAYRQALSAWRSR